MDAYCSVTAYRRSPGLDLFVSVEKKKKKKVSVMFECPKQTSIYYGKGSNCFLFQMRAESLSQTGVYLVLTPRTCYQTLTNELM